MNARNGFSLLELMIVLALVLVVMSLISVNVTVYKKTLLRSELNLLQTTCYYLQKMAIAHNQQQELIFDVATQSYSTQGYTHALPPHIHFGILDNVKGPPSSPQNAVHNPITFAHNTITFSNDGIISSGTIYLTDSQSLYALSSSVAHVSFLRTYHYNGKWHLIS